MISRERMLSAFNHPDPDRVPLFAPDAMNTREPYDDRVRRFLDDFAFDRSACLGGLIIHRTSTGNWKRTFSSTAMLQVGDIGSKPRLSAP